MLGVSVVLLAIIIFVTRKFYTSNANIPIAAENESGFGKVLSKKYYFDEIYRALIQKPIEWISEFTYSIVDRKVIDGVINTAGNGISFCGNYLRKLQSGNVEFYLLAMVIGVVSFLVIYQLV